MRKEGCECTGRLDARVEPRLVASFAAVSFPRFAPANLDGVDTIHGSVTSRGRLGGRSHERDGSIPSVCGFFLSRSFLGCSSSSSMSDKAFGRAEADGGRGKPHELDKRRIGNLRFALLLRLRGQVPSRLAFHPTTGPGPALFSPSRRRIRLGRSRNKGESVPPRRRNKAMDRSLRRESVPFPRLSPPFSHRCSVQRAFRNRPSMGDLKHGS